jgi:hypothetical protein
MVKVVSILSLVAGLGLAFIFGTAVAAPASPPQLPAQTGADVSYPQCGDTLPSGMAFGIVGVNGGLASNFNACLTTEVMWAEGSQGVTIQPKLALYANTGNPGDISPRTADWPTSSNPLIDPYGNCTGADDEACSWQYGYNRAYTDAATDSASMWWLDIETINSWSALPANNRADLEGMVYAFTVAGSRVGVYSLPAWWSQILGSVPPSSRLYSLVEWRPGASTPSEARANCHLASFTPAGLVIMTQYTQDNEDYDLSCF